MNQLKKHRSFSCYHSGFGFTLIELIASLLIGSIIISAALGGFFSLKQLFSTDKVKTDINQRLRSVFNTIGPDIQGLGQGLTSDSAFPAIVIEDDSNIVDSSRITIRTADLIGSLTTCEELQFGTSDDVSVINVNSTCSIGDDSNGDGVPNQLEPWRGKRLQGGGTIRAYIVSVSEPEKGEFFDYTDEISRDTNGNLVTPGDEIITTDLETSNTWDRDYPAGSTIYLLEERKYSVVNNNENNQKILQLVINDNPEETFSLAEGIDQLNATVLLREDPNDPDSDISCQTFPNNCDDRSGDPMTWDKIKSVTVEVTVEKPEVYNSASTVEDEDLTLSQEFLPRNVLSF